MEVGMRRTIRHVYEMYSTPTIYWTGTILWIRLGGPHRESPCSNAGMHNDLLLFLVVQTVVYRRTAAQGMYRTQSEDNV